MSSSSHAKPTAAQLAAMGIVPPNEAELTLASVDAVFSIIFFFLFCYISWSHGKPGIFTFTSVIFGPLIQAVGDIYLLYTRDQPLLPTAVSSVANVTVLAVVPMALSGLVYYCNVILPTPPKRRVELYILSALKMLATAGASMGFLPSAILPKVGHVILMAIPFMVMAWMVPTYQKIQRYATTQHPNALPAKHMLLSVAVALPFWIVRMATSNVYAFSGNSKFEPAMGTFATKFVLIHWMVLATYIALAAGGLLGRKRVMPVGEAVEYLGDQGSIDRVWGGAPLRVRTDDSDVTGMHSVRAGKE